MFDPDLIIPLAGMTLGGLIVLLPLAALVLRFSVYPLLERWAELNGGVRSGDHIRLLDQRLALLEQQVEHLEKENGRLMEDADFRAKLRASGDLKGVEAGS